MRVWFHNFSLLRIHNLLRSSEFRLSEDWILYLYLSPCTMYDIKMSFDVLMLTFDSLLAPISSYSSPFSKNFYKSSYLLRHSRKLPAKSIRNSLALLGRYMILQSQSSSGFSHRRRLVFSFFCLRDYFTLLWGYGLNNMPIRMVTSRLQCEFLTVNFRL